jgi:DAACS family dicarboxylate/amino acid:cation (Na+ or H+) symporter
MVNISYINPMSDSNYVDPTPDNLLEKDLAKDPIDPSASSGRGMALHTKILLGLTIGAIAGLASDMIVGPENPTVTWIVSNITEPVGTLFLRLLLMIVIPLVFSSLVVGITGVGNIRQLGRVAAKSFVYTVIISAISVVIGLTLTNTIRPGNRVDPAVAERLREQYSGAAAKTVDAVMKETKPDESPLMIVVKTLVPVNPVASIAGETPNMLHIMVFAVIFGIALTLVTPAVSLPVIQAMEGLYAASAKIVGMAMRLAPYAVGAILFTNTSRFGLDIVGALGWYVVTVLVGLAIHMFGIYSLSVYFLSRLNPILFFRRIKTVILTAFSTSSSNATLPTALRISQENLGVPPEINSFVLTVGATANQNGTALYEGVTVLFLAQLAGIELTLLQQLMVVYLAILGGIGTAGVPSGSIPFIIGVLATIGIDPALIAIILGVDRILDMCRTTLNVVGDITAATYVARSEGYDLIPTSPLPPT